MSGDQRRLPAVVESSADLPQQEAIAQLDGTFREGWSTVEILLARVRLTASRLEERHVTRELTA